jgi:hypothetical protein
MLESNEKKRGYLAIALIILAGSLTLWYMIGLAIDWPSWLRGGGGWVWMRHVPTFAWFRFVLLSSVVIIWLAVLGWVIQSTTMWARWQVGALLGWAVIFVPFTQLVIAAQHHSQPLAVSFLTTTAPTAGFFHEGVQIEDPVAFIQKHADRMPGYRGVHLQTQPPGWAVAFWAARQLWQQFPKAADQVGHWLLRCDCTSHEFQNYTPAQIASATLQMSLLLVSGFGVLPLYLLGRNLFSARVARLAVVSYPLLPGFLVFQAYFDVLYAILAIVVLWLAHRVLTKGHWRHFLVLAVLLVGMTLFSLGTLAVVALVNAFMLAYVWLWARSWSGIWRLVRTKMCISCH